MAILTQGVFGDGREWRRNLGLALGAGLFLGMVGPFGSYLNPARLAVVAYWACVLPLGALFIGPVCQLAMRAAAGWRLPPLPCLALATAVGAVPVSLACHAAAMLLWPRLIETISWPVWYSQTLLVSAPLAVANWAWRRDPAPVDGQQTDAGPAPQADFLTLLPQHLGRDLLALQMEDHYVRAYTSLGSALILTPLRQALAGVTAVPGLQVHRSWWVARAAVVSAVQDGRNLRLRLVNGLEAPVARSRVAAVRAEGIAI